MDTLTTAGKKQIILVVEDDHELQDMYTRRLTLEGYSIIQALNGVQGLEEALKRKPDLILLDVRMPEMTGVEMLKRLRGHDDWGASVPVILVTNIQAESEEEKAYIESTEPNYYLLKSNTNLNDLMEKIHSLIG